jgi:S1-C subfamily serine protease
MKYRPFLLTAAAVCAGTVAFTLASPVASAADDASGTPSESTSDLERVSAYVQPSVVYLDVQWTGYVRDTFNRMYLNNGRPFVVDTQCTGYVVNPDGYIATAGHCVDPGGDIQDLIVQQAAQWALDHDYYASNSLSLEDVLGFDDYTIVNSEGQPKGPDRKVTAAWGVSAGGVDSGESYQARVLKYQPFDKGDGAILKVEASDLPAIDLADTDDIDVGTEIVSVGYPASVDLVTDASFTPSFKDGTVSSSKTIQDGLLKVYEISAAVSGGMSGGPTVNLEGQVVGFNSFKIDASLESQQFNFVRPTEIVSELMADVGVDNELGSVSEQYRTGLDAYFAGDKTTAVESLQAVVDDQPTNELAQDFLSKAKDLPDPEPTDDGFPVVPVAIGVGLLLVIVAGGVAFAVVRPNRSTPGGAGPAGGVTPSPAPRTPAWDHASTLPIAAGGHAAPPATASLNGSTPASATNTTLVEARPVDAMTIHPEKAPLVRSAESAPQSGTAFCTSCGARALEHQRFCGSCGTPL